MPHRNLSVYAARQVSGRPHDSVTIHVCEPVPEGLSLDDCRALYQNEAAVLAELLLTTLPGGTLDALLCELMRNRASLLIAPLRRSNQ